MEHSGTEGQYTRNELQDRPSWIDIQARPALPPLGLLLPPPAGYTAPHPDPSDEAHSLERGRHVLQALQHKFGNASDPADWEGPCTICYLPFASVHSSSNCCSYPLSLPCRHVIGSDCFLEWATFSKTIRPATCPVCRAKVLPSRTTILGEHRTMLIEYYVLDFERTPMWRCPDNAKSSALDVEARRVGAWIEEVKMAETAARWNRERFGFDNDDDSSEDDDDSDTSERSLAEGHNDGFRQIRVPKIVMTVILSTKQGPSGYDDLNIVSYSSNFENQIVHNSIQTIINEALSGRRIRTQDESRPIRGVLEVTKDSPRAPVGQWESVIRLEDQIYSALFSQD